MKKKRRTWEPEEDDPTAGLVNLFDVWMVFAVALLLAMMGLVAKSSSLAPSAVAEGAEAKNTLEALTKSGKKVEKVRLSKDQLTGQGERLGTAYRLKSGEIVYIPEGRK
jgi:hypothetical protein